MSEIKYEPVFGDQSLFDTCGANPSTCFITVNERGFVKEFTNTEDGIEFLRINNKRVYLYSMRRIIRTPVWTKADQLAGKVPEVGAILRPIAANPSEFIGVDIKNNRLWWFRYNGGVFSCLASRCEPIETQEERLQRNENEFVRSLEYQCIAYANAFEMGAREAYRKLKIPEVRK